MSLQRSLALLIVGVMTALAVLAHASPPDPDWIGGFWDNGDYDDIILLVTSGDGNQILTTYSGDPTPLLGGHQ